MDVPSYPAASHHIFMNEPIHMEISGMAKRLLQHTSVVSCLVICASHQLQADNDTDRADVLEEIVVSSQKTEKPLQDIANAVSVLSADQLEAAGIVGLNGLEDGLIPSLRIQPYGSTPTSLVMAIRGFGPTDPGQGTREPSVAVYKNGFYIGRIQGLGMELADFERVEVFRGPQGSIFGRNAAGGAVNLITKKPTGEFGLKQTLSYGNLDALRSITRIDLPEFSGIRISADYIHSERDGWVKNLAEDQADFNGYNKDAGGVSLSVDVTDDVTLDYDFDFSHTEASMNYYQLAQDNFGLIGVEPARTRVTRFPITPLKPTVSESLLHSLTVAWQASEEITVKSLTSFRKLDEDTNVNLGGAAYFNGLTFLELVDQEQWTQEIQILGKHDRLEWVAGLYYFDEEIDQSKDDYFSLDIFGLITGTPLTPIIPPTKFDVLATQADVPLVATSAKTKSKAIYGQATWTPNVLDDRLDVTVGLRYTDDERDGARTVVGTTPFSLNADHLDSTIAVKYQWTDGVSSYAKWSTGFKAGSVSIRSLSFIPYEPEEVETFEVGLKSEFLDKRLRVNATLFSTNISNPQIDFVNPINPTILETFNGTETVEIDGLELEMSMVPVPGLVIGLNYTYLDGKMPLQSNPLAGGAPEQFNLAQTPEHAGSLTVDYTFPELPVGTLIAHADMTATDKYHYITSGIQELDSYALINARLTLADIPLGSSKGGVQLSLWAKNLLDSKYVIQGFPLPDVGAAVTYGNPRTYGVDLTYKF